MKKIIRVFPRKTNATPDDQDVRINSLPTFMDEADEVHISVAFTWDMKLAEFLAVQWGAVAPVKIGGPAFNEPGGVFVPGLYMKKGYVITSRGCPNRCWFCQVPKREGGLLRELPVTDGWILTDDNLLACSDRHINEVFSMLARQPYRPQFTGGLEAKLLTQEIAVRLYGLKPESLFFAYDTLDDLEPLQQAGKYLMNAGFKKESHTMKAYVLCGFPKDNTKDALRRIKETWDAGFFPMAMIYRDKKGEISREWKKFQDEWTNKIITGANIRRNFQTYHPVKGGIDLFNNLQT